MKYMLLIYGDEAAISQSEREACYGESLAYARQLHERGQFVAASPLQSINTAKSVRMREGQRLVTSGPFAETHEQLGGYYVVNAQDEEEALKIAEGIPGARWGTIEVRPMIELEGVPNGDI